MHTKSRSVLLIALVLLAGCQPAPAPLPEDTGSRQTVLDFFESLAQQEWPRGYAILLPEKKRAFTIEQFKTHGLAYRKRVGFDPESVQIRSCEEHGQEAIAHLSLIGHVQGQRKSFRESVSVKRQADKWYVVPPKHF